jgi:hypothetical protein
MLGADSSKDNRPVVQRLLPFGVIDCECAIGCGPRGLTCNPRPEILAVAQAFFR